MEFIIFVILLVIVLGFVMVRNRRPDTAGFPRGSVADLSAQIGYDIRDLWMAGYSDRQIKRVQSGEITVQQLLALRPEGNKHNRNPQS